jgi:hypothetical protein
VVGLAAPAGVGLDEPITQHLHDGGEALFCHREPQEHAPGHMVAWHEQLVRIRTGHPGERASIGDRLGAHQMPVLAVPYLIIGIGARPPVPQPPLGPRRHLDPRRR